MQPDQEFIFSVVVLGGIIFTGLLVVIGLTIVGIAIFKKSKQTLKTDEKQRSNGKAISRGKW